MDTTLKLAGIASSLTTVVYFIAGMLNNRSSSTTAKITKAVGYYRIATLFAAVAAGLELFDPDWFSLLDFTTLAFSCLNLWLARRNLAQAVEQDRLEAEHAAATNDLPWPS